MSEINLQLSMTNLTQMDRIQNDAHRSPMVHQAQNAQKNEDETVKRMNMPVEPENVEKKKIDPDRERREHREQKRKKSHAENKKEDKTQTNNSVSFIDIKV